MSLHWSRNCQSHNRNGIRGQSRIKGVEAALEHSTFDSQARNAQAFPGQLELTVSLTGMGWKIHSPRHCAQVSLQEQECTAELVRRLPFRIEANRFIAIIKRTVDVV